MANAGNYLRVVKLSSIDLGDKEFRDVTKEEVIEFLDKRKKSPEVDPDKK